MAVLTKIYIEALLVDEELADQVWEAWNSGEAIRPPNQLRFNRESLRARDGPIFS